MIHKPSCLKGNIREITRATGVYTPVELFNVEVQRRFYRSVSDKLPVSSCSTIVSVHNKHSPINKENSSLQQKWLQDGGKELFPCQMSACVNSLKYIKAL